MKGKFRKILGVGLVLALVLSLSLVVAVPVAAGTLSPVTATATSYVEGATTTYTIDFTTATTYEVDTVDMVFDTDFDVSSATLAEAATGIGAGEVSVSGQAVTYTVTTLAVIDTGTSITIKLGGIVNPSDGTYSEAVTVTTKSSTGAIVDTGTADIIITAVPVTTDVWVDVGATLDGTVDSYTHVTKTLVTNTDCALGYDSGDAIELLDGSAVGFVDIIDTISYADSVATIVLSTGDASIGGGDTFNLVDLDAPSSSDPFRYIQSAVDTASTDTIINVLPGTYTPPSEVAIATDCLTLKSTDGAEDTIIDAGSNDSGVHITGDDVTVEGFTITSSVGLVTLSILVDSSATGAIISGNVIENVSGGGASQIALSGVSDCEVSDNMLVKSVIWLDSVSTSTISGNQVWGVDGAGCITIRYTFTDNLIQGNSLRDGWLGIFIAPGSDDVTPANVSGLQILGNDITNNEVGIVITDITVWGAGNAINNNNIYDNGNGIDECGMWNATGSLVDAKYNWWGNPNGPGAAAFGVYPAGDVIAGPVLYSPWLTEPYTEEAEVDILAYYRGYSGDTEVVETTDLLKAANDWANEVVPPDFTDPISTTQLLALANEWAATD